MLYMPYQKQFLLIKRPPGRMITALHLLSLLAICHRGLGDTWTQMQVQCVPDTTALYKLQTSSEIQCTVEASNKERLGLLVIQFRTDLQQCSIFRYQSVCRQLLSGVSSDCRVLIRFPIKYSASALAKLTNVWVGDEMTNFGNLLCQTDETVNRIYPKSVQWSEDGAVFDGVNSYLAMNYSDITFNTGLTVLLRIKRVPQVQAFVEFMSCVSVSSSLNNHFWEHEVPNRPYVFAKTQANMGPRSFISTNTPMSTDPNEWIDLGFTSTPAGDSWGLFLGNAFLAPSTMTVTPQVDYSFLAPVCFQFGKRNGDGRIFRGTLRALAMGNSLMTESEIRDFFALL